MRIFLLLAALSAGIRAQATEWQALGPRPLAMGGAGVALAQGPLSSYWNPAALGLADNPSGVQTPVGVHLGISGSVLKGANDLNQVNKNCQAGNCSQADINNAFSALNDPGNGVRGSAGGGAALKIGRLGFFAGNATAVGAKPNMDTTNTTAATLNNNTSALELRGISLTEFGVAYGRELPFAPGLHAGLALKGMVGQVGFHRFSVISGDAGNGSLGEFKRNGQSSFQPGVDAGLLWDVTGTFENAWWRPRLGLTGRNLNNPRFKNSAAAVAAGRGSKYSVQGGLRFGAAVSPLKFWNLAADVDLTRNLTALEGVKSQQMGLGTEINVFNRTWLNIPLRAGLARNLADPSARTMLTAGFGLNFLHVNFDLGVQTTSRNQTVQSQGQSKKLPSEVAVSGQFAVLFGGNSAEGAERSDSERPKKSKPF